MDRFQPGRRTAIKLSQQSLVRLDYLDCQEQFPLVIEPGVQDIRLELWAASNRDFIEEQLLKHGAILFRGFNVESLKDFGEFVRAISPELLDYLERAAPRAELSRNLYTSTEYPADQHIPLHHEMSYSHNWPMKIWFFCLVPAQSGGRTPIANDRKVFKLIPLEIKERFMQKKVMYVRNYGEGVDLPWQEVFQTNDKSVVEAYCRKVNTEFEWRGGRLRTRQIRQAVATHPKTGETVWFNHAHLFHVSNLEPAVRDALLAEFKDDELPRNAFYGDGTPIEDEVLDHIRDIYHRAAFRFDWKQDDVLMLDNFLASHGREPYSGPRRIVVAMAELYVNKSILGATGDSPVFG